MGDIPYDIFKNLSSYEEFVIKANLIGKNPKDSGFIDEIVEHCGSIAIGGKLFLYDKKSVSIWIDNIGLTTLEGLPRYMDGDLTCCGNRLTTLKGCPEKVWSFYCEGNLLTSLEYGPKYADGGEYKCDNNRLVTLKGSPSKTYGDFTCRNNMLETLEGGPSMVYGNLDCSHNPLTSLKGAPSVFLGTLIAMNTHLSERQVREYKRFLANPSKDLMDESGHYKPKE